MVALAAIGQVVTIDMHIIATHAGHRRPALAKLRAFFGEPRHLSGGAVELIAVRIGTLEIPTLWGMQIQWLTVRQHIVERRVAVELEADAVVIDAGDGLAVEAEQRVLEGERLTTTNLFLLVADAEVTAATQLLTARVEVEVLGVLPAVLGLEVVELVAGADGIVDLPVAGQACPSIFKRMSAAIGRELKGKLRYAVTLKFAGL
jgi:hypothetical protein